MEYTATEKDVKFLNVHGHQVKTVADAQSYYNNLSVTERTGHIKSVNQWGEIYPDANAPSRPSSLTGDAPENANYPTEKPTVTMFFPKRVVLTLDPGLVGVADNQFASKLMIFNPGVQEVPLILASHPWLKTNGVVPYTGQTVPLGAQTAEQSAAVIKENQIAAKADTEASLAKTEAKNVADQAKAATDAKANKEKADIEAARVKAVADADKKAFDAKSTDASPRVEGLPNVRQPDPQIPPIGPPSPNTGSPNPMPVASPIQNTGFPVGSPITPPGPGGPPINPPGPFPVSTVSSEPHLPEGEKMTIDNGKAK